MELDPDDELAEAEGAALATTEDTTTDDAATDEAMTDEATTLGAALEPATTPVTEVPTTPVEATTAFTLVAETLPTLDEGLPVEHAISPLHNVWATGSDSAYSQEHRPR